MKSWAATDCKSLFDNLVDTGVTTIEDKVTALESLVARQAIWRTNSTVRWVPSF